MQQSINHKIRRGFSRSAKQYDQFSSLHRDIADRLLGQVNSQSEPSAILDVGCGTGYLTASLKEHFPQSQIIGLDFARGMLHAARQKYKDIDWVLADGNNLPFSDGCFDSVFSNLAYQWADDLIRVFGEARRVLLPHGVLACTLFGYDTCRELFRSLDKARSGVFKFHRLPDKTQILEALHHGGFTSPQVEVENITVKFKNMQELIAWLKSIGANNLSREGFLGPDTIARAAAIYSKEYSYQNGVGATFEVIQVYAKK